ncbi:DMT family transporter [Amycolatopsis sp. K13G38]|uniref:DMT family transporter n=1 Tax=Amycolatopsis acididurans TaxID=2724524 RepID=A0ABX1J914_9PSEU|nr:DMT family transporter [Amycolatopsis acididurans]NKQ56263.1 DMT family transporter [Amycolatopsis acididurans]
MFAVAVVLAAIGALLLAAGAAIQERAVVTALDSTRLRFFLRLLRNRRWLLGGLCAVAGVSLHVVALSNGPVSVIQPVGTLGLLFAVVAKAVLDGRKLQATAIAGCCAVVAGLAGLLIVLPRTATQPHVPTGIALLLASVTIAVICVVLITAAPPGVKAVLLALTAGSAFGIASAFIGVIGHRMAENPLAFVHWLTLLIIALLATGGVSQQQAYRMSRFALAYAVLLIADPVAASAVGILLIGDPLPSSPFLLGWMGVSALVIVLGVVVLARSYAVESERIEESRTCAS